MTRISQADAADSLAEAWRRGREAAAAGDAARAFAWLDRAARLAPEDDTVALTLAATCLGHDPARAAALFAGVAARHDSREAWLGLAAARRAGGDAAGAAAALGALLSRHAVAGDAVPVSLADAIAHAAGAPGWCADDGDGVLSVHGVAAPEFLADGQALRPTRDRAGRLRLPATWAAAWRIEVTARGVPLLGSPLQPARIRRVEGVVTPTDAGGIAGWAWHPADPARDPSLRITGAAGGALTILASAPDETAHGTRPLVRARRFHLTHAALAAANVAGAITVADRDGRALLGCPVDPGAERDAAVRAAIETARLMPAGPAVPIARASRTARAYAVPADVAGPSPPIGATGRRRPVAVVIPVHDGGDVTRACFDAVLATVPRGTRVVVVDDASRDPALIAALDALARRRRILLLRHAVNRGFVHSANAGLRAAAGCDVVLLNSDTLTPPGWLAALRAAALSAPDIGTASPLSNDATILSYPDAAGGNPAPDEAGCARMAALAARENAGVVVDVPTTVGFCMFIRRDCLDATGLFDAASFAQGYGEENDFCIRARHLGWRHVAVPGAYVAHLGGHSFGPARTALMARNMRVLNRLHPGYDALIGTFAAADPIAPARRRLDIARLRATRTAGGGSALIVTHDGGGGVERVVAARCDALRGAGLRPLVLRAPDLDPDDPGADARAWLCDGTARDLPNLRFALPAEMPALLRLLRAQRPAHVEFHHLLGHDASVASIAARLGVPHDVYVHDYAAFCPRLVLSGPGARYCGEPPPEVCVGCVADLGSMLDEDISVPALRARSAALLAGARRVVAPSRDAAARIRRQFPGVDAVAEPPEDDLALPDATAARPQARERLRVAVLGAIGPEKGLDVLVGCARDAAARDLPLEFVAIGHTTGDARLIATGRVFVTGPYRADELPALIARERPHLALLPSVVPETWCFTLSEAWRAGLDVVCFDLGAQAERVRARGRGLVLPPTLSVARINNALLAAGGQSGHECAAIPTASDPDALLRHPPP
jgi:GT2 family glycosyltransferase/glycosyltransferase involved in cell wall biosynthesis